MKISVVQTNPSFGKVTDNIQQAFSLMENVDADIFVLPELFSTGYNFEDLSEVEKYAEKVDGLTSRRLISFCKEKNCYIAYGFAEKADALYNSAALVGSGGVVTIYRKIHLFDRENILFARGNLDFQVIELPLAKIGLMICFDWIFPESARTLAIRGAEVILHPSNLVMPYCPDAMITRSIENRIFAATADRVGREIRGGRDLTFIGTSQITSPTGEVLCRLDRSTPGIGVVEIDPLKAKVKQLNQYNDLFADRRETFYLKG